MNNKKAQSFMAIGIIIIGVFIMIIIYATKGNTLRETTCQKLDMEITKNEYSKFCCVKYVNGEEVEKKCFACEDTLFNSCSKLKTT